MANPWCDAILNRVVAMSKKDSIDQLVERAKLAASKLGIIATGQHRKELNSKRQFEVHHPKKDEYRWSRLGHLESGTNPWTLASVVEQLAKAKSSALTLGLKATGREERRSNARYFEVQHPDGRTKYATLRNLQDGKNPFGKLTLEARIKDAEVVATKNDLKITGQFKWQGNRKIVEVITPSGRSVHMQLDAIKRGFKPRSSKEEQIAKAGRYANLMGISATGLTKRSLSGALLFEVSNGKDKTFCQMSHLKLGKNPWQAPFKINKNGYFYVYEILYQEKLFLGFGVTNNYQRRHSDHLIESGKIGAKIKRIELIQMHGAKCLELETSIKRLIKTQEHLNVIGFKTESAPFDQNLLSRIRDQLKRIQGSQ